MQVGTRYDHWSVSSGGGLHILNVLWLLYSENIIGYVLVQNHFFGKNSNLDPAKRDRLGRNFTGRVRWHAFMQSFDELRQTSGKWWRKTHLATRFSGLHFRRILCRTPMPISIVLGVRKLAAEVSKNKTRSGLFKVFVFGTNRADIWALLLATDGRPNFGSRRLSELRWRKGRISPFGHLCLI